MNRSSIRVLVCDDSATVRGLLTRALDADPEIVVSGSAMHGEAALLWLRRHTADVVVLDIEMPVMDGLETLAHIQQKHPGLPVIMVSSQTHSGAEATVKALSLGAAACIGKPQGSSIAASMLQLSSELLPLVRELGRKRRASPGGLLPAVGDLRQASPFRPEARSLDPQNRPAVVVIGSSTGGPRALQTVVQNLPSDFDVPILIAQHMPPTFTPLLARHLQQDSGRPCQEATHNQPVERGRLYLAPGDYHLSLVRDRGQLRTQLSQAPPGTLLPAVGQSALPFGRPVSREPGARRCVDRYG